MEAHLIDGAGEIDPAWVEGRAHIGVTAGASAPDVLVQDVLERLRGLGAVGVRELHGEPESMVFAPPKERGSGWWIERRPAARIAALAGIAQLVERRIRNA